MGCLRVRVGVCLRIRVRVCLRVRVRGWVRVGMCSQKCVPYSLPKPGRKS